ncbi:hypothetical protein K7432_015761 [Basidiobolus ranarum]|uniref:Fungal lipase-type domain-containing protein n=1 Tax=Basidiobolus ranarum TaxID=34480 RepID=A0ABR2VMM7_9FUNG
MTKRWVSILVVFTASLLLVQALPTKGNAYVEIDRSFRSELARHSIYSSIAYCEQLKKEKCWPTNQAELRPNAFVACCPNKPADLVITSHFKSSKYGLYGYIGYSNLHKEVVFAFKGTDKDMSIITDIMRFQMEYPYPNLPNSWLDKLEYVIESYMFGGVEVHSGFLKAFLQIRDIAYERLEELALMLKPLGKDYKLIITGHSMGGAVATIAAMELKRLYINPNLKDVLTPVKSLIPRSNNSPNINIARVTNYKDPVVGSNPKWLNSMHNPREIYLNEKGLAVYCHDVNGLKLTEDPNCNIGTVTSPLIDTVLGLTTIDEELVKAHNIEEYHRILTIS